MGLSDEYLAGFFDGEGHVLLRLRTHKATPYIDLAVELTNTCKDVLEAVQTAYNGRLSGHQNGRRTIYRLKWWSRSEASSLLKAIHPHLIVKKKKVGIILAYLDSRGIPDAQGKKASTGRYSEAEYQLLAEYQAAN